MEKDYSNKIYCVLYRDKDPYLKKGRRTLKRMKKERKRRK